MSGLIFYRITLYKLPASLPPLLTPTFFLPLTEMTAAKPPPKTVQFVEPLSLCKVETLLF